MRIFMVFLFVATIALTIFLNLGPQIVRSDHGEDKIAHFAFYFLLVIVFWKFMGGFALAFVAFLATLLEYLQSFVPRRTVSPYDLLASLLGALVGYYTLRFFLRRRRS